MDSGKFNWGNGKFPAAPRPQEARMGYDAERLADGAVFGRIDQGSSVLDLGCGDEELLSILARDKSLRA